ncbi:MAG TPA: LemA family protein [Planctomycetota bacterium]|nr:LemA family protein [Planctomycetota bacterium]
MGMVIGAVLCVIVGFGLICALWFMSAYNGLVGGRNKVKEAWAQIDVQLKRRYDLIPNLIETVKGYVKHEGGLLEQIAKARSGLLGGTPAQSAAADAALTGGLRQLWAVSENYPDLKANENFNKLHDELIQTENKIAFARQAYNESTLRYNDKTMMIPTNIVAGMFNFKPEQFFEVESAEERKAVKVQF